ncbi:glycosyltransferase family 4 protein [Tepidimonas taiwanensis]|uniref:glycosyltransferase family 4 protein n=1 Tax=Tepidimonas taiwanensis TaxID=307486 RepID=UPI001F24F96B|nr:glycosyltransferase family 4 protein [Tepidimonas taiwanensis]
MTATHVPFARGGAEAHMHNLALALRAAGHQAELLRVPFTFAPEETVRAAMTFCQALDLERLAGLAPQRVISLQFPAYGVRHPRHVVWLMHQHRAVYELYERDGPATPALRRLREDIHAFDTEALGRAWRRFANSRCVAQRLAQFNGLQAEPLYHPPPDAEKFFCGEDWGYVYGPSRLEGLKRQDLLLQAAQLVKAPVRFVLTGDGGMRQQLARMVEELGLQDRVWLRGHCSRAEQLAWYAHALAVFFGPFDEDYGYVTLEAMCAAKPVITCSDSGGPLEFVQHRETGLVCEPQPQAVADAIEQLWADRARARAMGREGRLAWEASDISWDRVVQRLLED